MRGVEKPCNCILRFAYIGEAIYTTDFLLIRKKLSCNCDCPKIILVLQVADSFFGRFQKKIMTKRTACGRIGGVDLI